MRAGWFGALALVVAGSACGQRRPSATAADVASTGRPPIVGASSPASGLATSGLRAKLTLYYLAEQACGDASEVDVPTCDGATLVRASKRFLDAAKMQGSARLCDGRVINIKRLHPACFAAIGASYPWGATASGRPAEPYRSIAVDPAVLTLGRWYYAPEFDGLELPSLGPSLPATKHDGCVRADDRGGGVHGAHVDWFVGSHAALSALAGFAAGRELTVYDAEAIGRCSAHVVEPVVDHAGAR
jgi:3D (Asp-Asp-Asp) domain-containing protein